MISLSRMILVAGIVATVAGNVSGHVVRHALLSYPVLGSLCADVDHKIAVEYVFSNGDERVSGAAPSDDALRKFSHIEYYFTIGAPVEESIAKALRRLNPTINVFSLTNGCELIEGNYYVWCSWYNVERMRRNLNAIIDGSVIYGNCGGMTVFKGLYRGRGISVGIDHDAFEYFCRFLGVEYVRVSKSHDIGEMRSKNIALLFSERAGLGTAVREVAQDGVVMVEADPMASGIAFKCFEAFAKALQREKECVKGKP